MVPIIKELRDTQISYEQLLDLIHSSFEERQQQGIHFTCSDYTLEDLKERTKDGHVLVALDEATGTLMGTATLFIRQNGHSRYGYNEIVAISDKAKRCGVGSKLVHAETELAKEMNCEYILSDTSVLADSSVMWHQKNGFYIIGLESYRSTDYWSYVFRKQIHHPSVWDNAGYRKLRFIMSFVFIKTTRNVHGQDTLIGKIYKGIRNTLRRL